MRVQPLLPAGETHAGRHGVWGPREQRDALMPAVQQKLHALARAVARVKAYVKDVAVGGHQRIALLAGPEHSVASGMRLACWQEVLDAHGLAPCAVLHGDWSSKDAWQQTLSLFRTRRDITALVVANDQIHPRVRAD
ncbi:hypothetical protein [Cronobacter sakazakii]|uniref:hypothetical protein n=1 Tax=Cronobacter sakazakii TaxID=28141 RepID=UPI001EFD00F2|nr:hypothetical protein [Cronobacter sakazakii]